MANTRFANSALHGRPNLAHTHRAYRFRNGTTARERTLWVVTVLTLQIIAAIIVLYGYAHYAPSPGTERGDQGVSNATFGR
jgi:hypothetical protein